MSKNGHMDNTQFWAGAFGDEYVARNTSAASLAARIAQFAQILRHTNGIGSVTELGANVGLNLLAIRALYPRCELAAVEINTKAVAQLRQIDRVSVTHASLLDVPAPQADIALTAGVLIHMEPNDVPRAYQRLFAAARRYVLLLEYYNPTPVEVSYRGQAGRLFKRDWAGEMIDTFPSLKLKAYGFFYRRDPAWPEDDVNWFLLAKL